MKFFKTRLQALIFVFTILPLPSHARLEISSWQESSQLTESGKSSEIVIRGKVSELPANAAMSSFSIIFDPNQNIRILKVISDEKLSDYSKNANYTFRGNALTVKFLGGKKNGDNISVYLSYDEKYDKVNRFLRQEIIYVPEFAVGAKTTVTFNFPGYFESATFNPNVTKVGNSFVYSSVVPQGGVKEIIKLTPSQNIWNIAVKTTISGSKALGKLNVKVPTFFQNAHQKVENYDVFSSINPIKQNRNSDATLLDFNTNLSEIFVSNNARVTTGAGARGNISRNAADYISNSSEEFALLSPILQKIKSDPRYGNIPLYAKIGKFVHEFLEYDLRYLGKLPKLSEIVQQRRGVCTEYARLFDALARLAGIPSVIIDGGACGEYDECQGHSWNMIYQGGKWIEVDPTWDLMSGIVSSSHVYFNDAGKGQTGVEYFDSNQNMRIKADLEMKNLL